jgi:glycosyltransferase involved in cell wall biosynthesis
VAEQVSRAQVLVHPSQYETFGVAIIEALALGKPVIATRCGGPDAIVTPHDGMLVPVGDEQVLAEAMWTMRERIGDYDAAGIRRACLARFGERAVVERLTQVYAGVIAESANGRAAMALPGGARS